MAKEKRRKFKGGVTRNAEKQAQKPQHRHLNLPRGLQVFKETPKTRIDLDILPYIVKDAAHADRDEEYGIAVPGELWYKRPYFIHKNIGPNSDTIVCPRTIKQPCPICEHREQLLKDGGEWDDDAIKGLKPSLRNLYLVIPKNQKDYEEEPHVWDISQYLFQDKLNEEVQENEENESFPDLEDGRTLRIRFGEDTFGKNKFAVTSRIDFVERTKAYPDAILDELPSLDDIIIVPSRKAIEAIFFGGMAADELDDDEDNPKPATTKEESKSKKKTKPEPEEDPEEEEEEEEEEETPKAKTKSSKTKPEPEPAEEEEPEEEEEEEKPTPKKKTKPETKEAPKSKKGKSGECPHGHAFGKDNDMHDECDDCDSWDACAEACG